MECRIRTDTPDKQTLERSILDCHKRLAGKVDAMYITNSIGVSEESLPALLVPFMEARTPTFAQMGYEAVRSGALMSVSEDGQDLIGLFHARTLAQILHGASPRALTQEFAGVTRVAVNLDTAAWIGFQPPRSLMVAAVGVRSNEGEANNE